MNESKTLPTQATGMTGGSRLSRTSWREHVPGLLFVAPALLLTFGLFLLPLARVAWISLHEWPILGEPTFIGTKNYVDLIDASEFRDAILFTTKYTLIVTPAILIPALALALLVNERLRGVTVFRAIYFTPYVIAFVTGSLMWKWLYNDVFGLFNYLLLEIGLIDRPILWLGSPNMALLSIVISVVWKTAGFNMVLLLGGLQAIPSDLYEAAALDGAGAWKRFLHITLPLLRSTLAVVLTVSIIGSFLAFDQFQVMTAGGPGHATTTIVMLIRKTSFEFFDFGAGAAMSIVLLVILMILSYLQINILRQDHEA